MTSRCGSNFSSTGTSTSLFRERAEAHLPSGAFQKVPKDAPRDGTYNALLEKHARHSLGMELAPSGEAPKTSTEDLLQGYISENMRVPGLTFNKLDLLARLG